MSTLDAEGLGKFARLEERIAKLLEVYEAVLAENAALKDAIAAKNSEMEELRERAARLDREKGAVKEKVELLLTRLDGMV
ncbi:MAG: cell division protein ZapB [Deltaproteobacteria bacterium]|nr:cell division protein ZapB [Deltaproteobacteria bacterium]